MPPKATFFKPEEVAGLDDFLVAKLDLARGAAGVPFLIVSGKRTAEDNAACGGANHSTHCDGLGVDIGLGHLAEGYERNHARFLILRGLMTAGFKRLGLYPAHIHCDIGAEPTYPQDDAWFKEAEG